MKTNENTKLQKIEITMEEIRMATRPNVYRDRSKYRRTIKHKNRGHE